MMSSFVFRRATRSIPTLATPVHRGVSFSASRHVGDASTSKSSSPLPAAGVPNSQSPFQLIPELLKQQKVHKEGTRVPLDKRGYTAPTLLKSFGRSMETKLPDVESLEWEEVFRLNNQKLDKMGLGVKDRRYLLWCLEKYRQGEDPRSFAKEETPKKTIRGWGPPVRKATKT